MYFELKQDFETNIQTIGRFYYFQITKEIKAFLEKILDPVSASFISANKFYFSSRCALKPYYNGPVKITLNIRERIAGESYPSVEVTKIEIKEEKKICLFK